MNVRRKDVVEYAEATEDADYGRCQTCKHYGRAIVCGACYTGHRYSFDWRHYLENEKEAIESFLRTRQAKRTKALSL